MYYTNGNYSMGGNFKIKKQAPMDDRSTVAKKIDLQNPNLFDGFTYNGMIVSVVDDTINNGIYRLEDKSTKTWVKEGNPNTGGTTGDYNDLINKPNFKTINNQFIVGSGNLDIKSELYNYGFNLKGIYSNIAELRKDESNPIHKDTDIWMTKESLDFVFVNDEPVYIAPDGSDETGDGSYDNPYRTFTNIPKNSLIKLKAGQYRGSDYGYFSLSYGKVHGLFKGLMSGEATSDTRPNNPNRKEIPKDYKAKLVALNSAFTRMETFSVITKESDAAVVEIIDDVGTATEAKPWFRFYGATTDLWIFKDLKFIRRVVLTSTNTNSTIALMESANFKALVVEDCVFECSGGRYGYNYSTSSYILLNRCRFDNGTIAHLGPAVVLNNDSMDVYRDAINIVPTALYIYYANQSKFIPFNLPKAVDGDPYPVKFEGLGYIISPNGTKYKINVDNEGNLSTTQII